MGTVLFTRNPAGRAPGVPLRLACLFNRPVGQTPRAHEVQDTAAQGTAQPGPGRQRPPAAVTVHRTRAGAQERGDRRGVAGVGGQEECHLRLVAGREPCGQLGLLLRMEEASWRSQRGAFLLLRAMAGELVFMASEPARGRLWTAGGLNA